MIYGWRMTYFRTIFLAGLICLIALAGGTASALYALNNFNGFNQLTIGQWQASPLYASADADPYARAQRTRAALLPLGSGEGQRFTLTRDETGAKLDPRCTYHLYGTTPSARFWTLHTSTLQDFPLVQKAGLPQNLHSQMILYQEDSSFTITVSSTAQPENWLAVNATRPYQLVMTLYDTELGTSIGFETPKMPVLQRLNTRCPRDESGEKQ